jgi:ADP-heptose:LPS heptosyltransferase
MSQILFVQLSRLGDCLQSTPLLASWRRRYPQDRIVVLVRAENAPVFAGSPDIDEVLIFTPPLKMMMEDSTGPLEKLHALHAWIGSLKARQFHTVVNLTHDSLSSWLVAALEPAETRGLVFNRSGEFWTKDPWSRYILCLLKFRRANLLNIADAYAHYAGGGSVRDTPLFKLDRETCRNADQWLADQPDHPCIIGFQPGASTAERRWPPDCFIRLGQQLVANHGAVILVFGTKDEEALAAKIVEGIAGSINLAGKTNIPQLAALLSRCRILVTNDTGTMHLAAATGTRVVALFESSAYLRETGPYGSGHWILQSAEILDYGDRSRDELSRIQRIPVEEVFWAVRSLLEEKAQAEPVQLPERGLTQQHVSHYRSIWREGHLDFYPVQAKSLDDEILCSYLQRPVWLASLGSTDLNVREEVLRTLGFLRRHFIMPSGSHISRMIEGLQAEIQVTAGSVSRMKNLIQYALDQLRRNPHYLISQDRIAALNELERNTLQGTSQFGLQPFVAYFETVLAMVGGETTRQYLQSYLQPVLFLDNQLRLFDQILDSTRVLTSESQATPDTENR